MIFVLPYQVRNETMDGNVNRTSYGNPTSDKRLFAKIYSSNNIALYYIEIYEKPSQLQQQILTGEN